MDTLQPPGGGERDWVGLSGSSLPLEQALAWVSDPSCGAVVLFSGVVRNHAEGRPGVTRLDYEAYVERAGSLLEEIAREARSRWPELVKLVAMHRTGELAVGDVAVVVVASTPHRDSAFEAARWTIDTVKASLPIWKLETWDGGHAWSEACTPIVAPGDGADQAEVIGTAAPGETSGPRDSPETGDAGGTHSSAGGTGVPAAAQGA